MSKVKKSSTKRKLEFEDPCREPKKRKDKEISTEEDDLVGECVTCNRSTCGNACPKTDTSRCYRSECCRKLFCHRCQEDCEDCDKKWCPVFPCTIYVHGSKKEHKILCDKCMEYKCETCMTKCPTCEEICCCHCMGDEECGECENALEDTDYESDSNQESS